MLNTKITAHLVTTHNSAVEVETRIDYTAFDPFAIHLQFRTSDGYIDWSFGRTLLLAGMSSEFWVGQGDVRITRHDEATVALMLTSPDGQALFLLDLVAVSRFVGRTLLEMPLGDELVTDEALLAGLAGR